MTEPTLKILHLATESVWRGGENQVRLLIEGSRDLPVEHHVVVRADTEPAKRFAAIGKTVTIGSSGRLDLPAAMKLVRYCRDQQISVVDAQSSHTHNLGLLMKLQNNLLKLVVHRRVDYTPGRDWLNRFKYKSPLIDRYVAISNAIAGILQEYGIAAHKIAVVPSAVDPQPYMGIDRQVAKNALAAKYQVDPRLPFIGNASALTEQKGYEVWLEALAKTALSGQLFHGFIAGKGHLEADLKAQAKQLGLQDKVTFMGFTDDVPGFLSGLDLMLISSHFEGLGTIILEAIYAGTPVVATAVGGIPEIITPEKTGYQAPPNDPEALANNIQKALQDSPTAAAFATAARQHIDAHFSLDAMVQGNISIYSHLLAGS